MGQLLFKCQCSAEEGIDIRILTPGRFSNAKGQGKEQSFDLQFAPPGVGVIAGH